MYRALPNRTIDRIRDGVPAADLRKGGDRAVWNALVGTAGSASQRGWEAFEWADLVMEAKSRLGNQARIKNNKRQLTERELVKKLDAAWDKATAWVTEQPRAWTREEGREEAVRRAAAVTALAADADLGLLDSDRAVMVYVAALAVRRGMDRLALPWRAVAAGTGLGERSAKNALKRLDAAGLLVLVEHGVAAGPSAKKARANLYRLADADALAAYQYRGTRSVGPAGQICGTPTPAEDGTPAQICGTPHASPGSDSEAVDADIVTVTMSVRDAERFAAMKAAERRPIEASASAEGSLTHLMHVGSVLPRSA